MKTLTIHFKNTKRKKYANLHRILSKPSELPHILIYGDIL